MNAGEESPRESNNSWFGLEYLFIKSVVLVAIHLTTKRCIDCSRVATSLRFPSRPAAYFVAGDDITNWLRSYIPIPPLEMYA